tara:strand:+ start:339 stop:530 length:192 start_codon:yes stop_codon:yes gene_type:complete
MNEPQHISSFVPGALNELLAMIERGEREREKEVDSQTEFDFTLTMNEQETSLRNLENYETIKR